MFYKTWRLQLTLVGLKLITKLTCSGLSTSGFRLV